MHTTHTAPRYLGVLLVASVLSVLLAAPFATHASTAPGEAGLSQTDSSATPLTDFEKQALTCRATAQTEALLKVGMMTPLDRQVLALGTSPLNDWCVYLKTHLANTPDNVEGLNPGFGQCLMKFFEAGDVSGAHLTIESGYRDAVKQAALFDAEVKMYSGNVQAARVYVAPPPCDANTGAIACGNGSMHNRGLAADLLFNGSGMPKAAAGIAACAQNSACAWAHTAASGFGLDFRINNAEVWHIEPLGSACQIAGTQQTLVASADTTAQTPVAGSGTTAGGTTATNNSTMQQLLNTVSSVANSSGASTVGGITGPGSSQINNLIGSLFNTILSSFASSSGQSLGSSLFQGVNTGGKTGGITQYLVLSEDGTLLGQSTVSAQDAVNKASAFFGAGVGAASTQSHLVSDNGTSATPAGGSALDTYVLANGMHVVLSQNTFSNTGNQANTSSGTVTSGSTNIGMSFVQSFIQTIFGILGNVIGNLGKGTQ